MESSDEHLGQQAADEMREGDRPEGADLSPRRYGRVIEAAGVGMVLEPAGSGWRAGRNDEG